MHTSTQSYECSVGQMNKSKNGGFLLMRVNLLGLPFFFNMCNAFGSRLYHKAPKISTGGIRSDARLVLDQLDQAQCSKAEKLTEKRM